MYILDTGSKLYRYIGQSAKRFLRAYALDLCLRIKENDRQGKVELFTVQESVFGKTEEEFWNIIWKNKKQTLNQTFLKNADNEVLSAEHGISVSR